MRAHSNYSKLRRFCTSPAHPTTRPKNLDSLRWRNYVTRIPSTPWNRDPFRLGLRSSASNAKIKLEIRYSQIPPRLPYPTPCIKEPPRSPSCQIATVRKKLLEINIPYGLPPVFKSTQETQETTTNRSGKFYFEFHQKIVWFFEIAKIPILFLIILSYYTPDHPVAWAACDFVSAPLFACLNVASSPDLLPTPPGVELRETEAFPCQFS